MNSTIQIVRAAIEQSALPAPRKRRLLRRLHRQHVIERVEEYATARAIDAGVIDLDDMEPADMASEEPGEDRRDWEAFGKFLRESLLPFLITLIELFARLAAATA